ncbi:MAG TPA: lanthionine synthetase LanC family protein [Jiangellales bacterium]|nr:lanthionine synthetase LanC family protein [Jiangellales bacterium]
MTRTSTDGDLLPVVLGGSGPDAVVERQEQWLVVRPGNAGVASPRQGWKLHVSAHPSSARTVLDRCLPVLRAHRVRFKVAASVGVVAQLNIGIGGPSQIGKFITVYPDGDAIAVRVAADLDAATRGLPGPAVPSDRRLGPGSLVHYRFGSFDGPLLQLPDGTVASALTTPDGELVPDERHPYFSPPDWAADPFRTTGGADPVTAASAATEHTRYRVVTLLAESGRGSVLLGVDVAGRRRCVLKTAHRGGHVDDEAAAALRREATVLQRLGPTTGAPAFYDLLELDDEVVLVMEDVPGRTLAEHVADAALTGRLLDAATVATIGGQLATMLAAVHHAGLVYRDLKSSNVVLGPDGQPRLLDFELAAPPGTGPRGVGTRGYLSPQQLAGQPSAYVDDVYGLGAVLYLLATGADPCRAPDPRNLLTRPIRLINPAVPPALADTIAACLCPDPGRRPADMAAVARQLTAIHAAPPDSVPAATPVARPVPDLAHRRERCAAYARRLGDTLCDEAVSAPGGHLTWTSTAPGSLPIPYRQINNGTPGVVLALTELWRAFGVPRHRATVDQACSWLATSAPLPGALIAGLHAGEAGVGAALLRAGQVLRDDRWVNEARRTERRLRDYPYEMPDLYHGTAGRLRFVVLLWRHIGDPAVLDHARACADALLAQATAPRPDELCWTIGAGHGGFSGLTEPGYAHGAAGIADTLLDLYEATGNRALADAAVSASTWVRRQAVTTLPDGSGLDWGHGAGFSGLWCYGAAGVGRLFLRLAALGLGQQPLAVAGAAGRTVAHAGRHAGTSQCHGLAGSIEYLLDLHQATGDPGWLSEAWELGALLLAFAVESDGQLRWLSDDGDERGNNAYMVGFAGVATTLLRLWDLESFPYELSLAGFRSHAVTDA